MSSLHDKVMAMSGVLEFRHHHEVAMDHQGRMVFQTRAAAVFARELGKEQCEDFAALVLSEPPKYGFSRVSSSWEEPDLYGKPSVVVMYTDVERPYGTCRVEAR